MVSKILTLLNSNLTCLLTIHCIGHWIQVCPTKKTGSKKKKSDHVPVPGKDPSPDDIEQARALQKLPPPKCFCGLPSRLNKVKKSKESGDNSRAIGKYLYAHVFVYSIKIIAQLNLTYFFSSFFCSKKRDDDSQCRFARPVDLEISKQKAREGAIKAAKDRLKDVKPKDVKPKKDVASAKLICKFFLKKGVCKKGQNCEFSHDVQSKKAPTEVSSSTTEQSNKHNNGSTSDSDVEKEENASGSNSSCSNNESDSDSE